MDGLLVIDKPAGPTSHDVVARMRQALGERRIGHTGTLDPAATGVLTLVLGRATRLAQFLNASDKSYEAVVRLGFSTDTADAQGRALASTSAPLVSLPSRAGIDAALDAFRGTFLQQPPAFSAKKIDGTRSHTLARTRARAAHAAPPAPAPLASAPLVILPAPARVTAHAIDIVSVEGDRVTLRVDCSAGFYVRSLAHDLGERLGTGAHLATLRRTRSGEFTLDRAIDLDMAERDPDRTASAIIPLAEMLPGLGAVVLTMEGVRRATHGRDLGAGDTVRGVTPAESLESPESQIPSPESPQSQVPNPKSRLVRLLDPSGALVGIAVPATTPGFLHPSVVLM